MIQNQVIKLVGVYRPPSSTNYPQPVSLFFEAFSTYLEHIVISTERLLISGDFNFHVESTDDTNVKRFCELLETFGLTQHVACPTHTSGHTLDLIISRSINDVIITELESTLVYLIIRSSSVI
jgi:exonuclease III